MLPTFAPAMDLGKWQLVPPGSPVGRTGSSELGRWTEKELTAVMARMSPCHPVPWWRLGRQSSDS